MQQGMYHKKLWLLKQGDSWVAVHGSGNATARGLLVNGEQMTVDRPWMAWGVCDREGKPPCQSMGATVGQPSPKFSHDFEFARISAFCCPGTGKIPTVEDFWSAWRCVDAAGLEPDLPPNISRAPDNQLAIPTDLIWDSGRIFINRTP